MSGEEDSKNPSGLPIIPDKKTGHPIWIDVREMAFRYLLPVSRVKRFFEALEEGKMLATRCSRCGAAYFPPQADCSSCGSSDMEWFEINGRGRLLTYSVINVKPETYSSFPDYIVGVARLEEGFNVLAWVDCSDPKKLRRGMPVRLEVKKRDRDGLFSYYIVPEK